MPLEVYNLRRAGSYAKPDAVTIILNVVQPPPFTSLSALHSSEGRSPEDHLVDCNGRSGMVT